MKPESRPAADWSSQPLPLLGEADRNGPETLQEYVTDAIRSAIFAGTLQPGSRLSPQRLAQQLQTSHIPIREALAALEAAGHVTRIARRGFFVKEISLDDVEDIYHWRGVLEEEAHRMAVPLLADADIAELETLHEAMAAAVAEGNREEFLQVNRSFHSVPFRRAGSDRLVRFLENLWDSAARYQSLLVEVEGELSVVQKQHDGLLRAFKARDVNRVNRISAAHRTETLRLMGAVLMAHPAQKALHATSARQQIEMQRGDEVRP